MVSGSSEHNFYLPDNSAEELNWDKILQMQTSTD